ncbi:ionotropic receptor 21a-like isoform X1 [Macrobrachium nipponense]|uniref:ionotropic receptor 21a-like isoform X1 n=1 Tax=Macrobrachium nipponense TaxID=159736 RepID=UPI0030C8C1D4
MLAFNQEDIVDTNSSFELPSPPKEQYNQSFLWSELPRWFQNEGNLVQAKNVKGHSAGHANNCTVEISLSFSRSQLDQGEKFLLPSRKAAGLYGDLANTSHSSEQPKTARIPKTQQQFRSSKTDTGQLSMSQVPKGRNLRGNGVLLRYREENSERAKEQSLERLLRKIIELYLKECDLILVADRSFQESNILEVLVRSSNLKQVVFMNSPEDLSNQVVWTTSKCQGTLILVSDPQLLIDFGNGMPFLWDYEARVIIVGLTEEFLDMFTGTKMGRKTEHIVGVVQDKSEGRFRVYLNQLFWGEGMKYITSWYGRGFTSKAELFPDKISNLRRGVVRVLVFEWQPAIIYHRDPEGNLLFRYGRDPAVVEALAKVFNFTILYKDPPDGQQFGLKLPNGSFDGMVGLLGSHEGDIAIANLYMSAIDGRDQFQEYSSAFAEDKSCYMARVDLPLPRWQSLGLPFRMATWIAIFVGLLLSGPLLYVLAVFSEKSGFEEPGFRHITLSIFYTCGAHFSYPLRNQPMGSGLKIFVVFLWIYILLISTGYRSNLTAFLTVVRQPASIETFKDLYESGLQVMGIPFFKTSLEFSGNQYLRALVDKFRVSLAFRETTKDVLDGKAVTINSRIYLEAVGAQLKRKGKPLVRIMKECFSSYAVGLAYPRNSPLKSKFDLWISRIFDSGLVRRWLLNSLTRYQKLQKGNISANDEEEEEEEAPQDGKESAGGATPLSLEHMQGLFIILGFGFALSTVAFSIEMFAA